MVPLLCAICFCYISSSLTIIIYLNNESIYHLFYPILPVRALYSFLGPVHLVWQGLYTVVWLFNMSIRSAIFPMLWKRAIVTPVQKSSKSAALTNFCPISVLPVMSKLFERVVYDQLLAHINDFDLLSISQSGFYPGCSTLDIRCSVMCD